MARPPPAWSIVRPPDVILLDLDLPASGAERDRRELRSRPGRTRGRLGATALYAPVTDVTVSTLGITVPPARPPAG
jgi:hypothetical protein